MICQDVATIVTPSKENPNCSHLFFIRQLPRDTPKTSIFSCSRGEINDFYTYLLRPIPLASTGRLLEPMAGETIAHENHTGQERCGDVTQGKGCSVLFGVGEHHPETDVINGAERRGPQIIVKPNNFKYTHVLKTD